MRVLELLGSGTVGTEEMGPVSTVVCELANRFAALGHEVTVADAKLAAGRPLLHPRITLVEVAAMGDARLAASPAAPLRRRRLRQRNTRTFLHDTFRALCGAHFDAVHVHRPELGVLLRRVHGQRYFYTAHTPTWCLSRLEPTGQRRRTGLGGLYKRRQEIEAIRHAQTTVALGPYLQTCCPQAPIASIPNGVDLRRWQPGDRAAARHRLGIGADEFLLVCVGRVAAVKGIDVLVEAVRRLAPRLPGLRVLVIGSLSGSFNGGDCSSVYAEEVLKAARGLPIEFLGRLPNASARFRSCLSAADAAVVPSRFEPFGLVAIECLAMALPVIASDTGGLREVVTDAVGRRVRPGDPRALAQAIEAAYAQPEELAGMRAHCRAHVAASFTWERAAQAHLELFARIIEASTPRGWPDPAGAGL